MSINPPSWLFLLPLPLLMLFLPVLSRPSSCPPPTDQHQWAAPYWGWFSSEKTAENGEKCRLIVGSVNAAKWQAYGDLCQCHCWQLLCKQTRSVRCQLPGSLFIKKTDFKMVYIVCGKSKELLGLIYLTGNMCGDVCWLMDVEARLEWSGGSHCPLGSFHYWVGLMHIRKSFHLTSSYWSNKLETCIGTCV